MRLLLVLALLLAACNRGPEPSSEPSAPTEPPPAEAPAELPSVHPPTNHPPVGATAGGPSAVDPAAPSLAGLRWTTHEPLTWRQPSSAMRAAEYFVAGEGGEALLTVFHFPGMGGSVQDNVARWVGQFQGPGGQAAPSDVQTKNVAGLEVTTIDVTGTFAAGAMMGTPGTPQPDQRLLGAIVDGPQGPVFFKLVGPASTVESAKQAFDDLVASFEAG